MIHWRRLLLQVLFASLSTAAAVSASASTVVPESVAMVLTGGYWSDQGRSGTYRVVIVREPGEPVNSRVFVEWLAQAQGGELALVTRVEPKMDFGRGVGNLRAALRPAGSGRVRIQLVGVLANDPARKVRAMLIATKPGKIAVGVVQRKKQDQDGSST